MPPGVLSGAAPPQDSLSHGECLLAYLAWQTVVQVAPFSKSETESRVQGSVADS